MTPDAILSTYDAVAAEWDRRRDRTLYERRHLDRMLTHATGRRVLDLGCGTGRPIAQYLVDRRCTVTGVDGAPAMIERFRKHVPQADAIMADMRGLELGESFDAILAWDSFFHLSPDDQRAMIPVFAAHAAPRGVLMFTAGPHAGEPVGEFAGQPLYHASLEPEEYRSVLDDHGFTLIDVTYEDPEAEGHTVFLARLTGGP
jgi:trans-aconitate methyltransferase